MTVPEIINMMRRRLGSAFDDEATFSAEEVELIMSALSTPPQPVFADRHNDETGECEMVDAEPEMVAALRRKVEEAKTRRVGDSEEVKRFRVALTEILDPISGMRARMNVPDGEALNGPMAIGLSNNPNYLKQIARDALYPKEQKKDG